jgi:hypothetical protein
LKKVLGALILSASFAAQAAPVAFFAKVTGVVASGDRFGGCMARLNPAPQTVPGLETCGNNFVSFDCNNDSGVSSRSGGTARYSNAQLALVTGANSFITVNPDVELNGRCFAEQIETQPAAP